MENRVLQRADVNSVINVVCCLNITQSVSCLPWWLWCNFEQLTVENPLIFLLTAENSQQIIVMLKVFTLTFLFNPQFFCMTVLYQNFSEAEDQNVSKCRAYKALTWIVWYLGVRWVLMYLCLSTDVEKPCLVLCTSTDPIVFQLKIPLDHF